MKDATARLLEAKVKPGLGLKKAFAKLETWLGEGGDAEHIVETARVGIQQNPTSSSYEGYIVVTSERILLAGQTTTGFAQVWGKSAIRDIQSTKLGPAGHAVQSLEIQAIDWHYYINVLNRAQNVYAAITRLSGALAAEASAEHIAEGVRRGAQPSMSQQLAELADLHAKGVLSSDEFNAAKDRIIRGT